MGWKGIWRTWSAAWQEARSNRAGFWAQVLSMAINDVAWVIFWMLFFRRANMLRGWDLNRVLVLFVGRNEAGELGFHALFLFSSYPTDVFGGFMKVGLYVAIPAGFVSGAPARLVDHFDPVWAAGLLAAALAFAAVGWATFTLGLRRYTSGAVWTNV